MNIDEVEFVAHDIESTGLSTTEDRIVEFGSTIFKGGELTARGSSYFNPGIPIHDEARKVHGISNDMVKDHPSFSTVVDRIINKFDSCDLIVGYNCLRFDVPMLNEEIKRAGTDWLVPVEKVLDLMVFVNWYHRNMRPRTQENIGEKLYDVVPMEGAAHNAAVDTQMTGELLLAMVKAGVVPNDLDLAFAEQARVFPIIEKEYSDWGPWLYRDRKTHRVRMGAGKHCGKLLSECPKTSFNWYLTQVDDLQPSARVAFKAAQAGRTQEEIQDSLFESTERENIKKSEDDVSGWGG